MLKMATCMSLGWPHAIVGGYFAQVSRVGISFCGHLAASLYVMIAQVVQRGSVWSFAGKKEPLLKDSRCHPLDSENQEDSIDRWAVLTAPLISCTSAITDLFCDYGGSRFFTGEHTLA